MKNAAFSILACALLLLAGCLSPSEAEGWTPHGEELEPVKVNDFTLTSSEGTEWTYSEHGANTTLAIAFLFTNCLDICPIVTYNMKWVKSQLSQDELNQTTFLTPSRSTRGETTSRCYTTGKQEPIQRGCI